MLMLAGDAGLDRFTSLSGLTLSQLSMLGCLPRIPGRCCDKSVRSLRICSRVMPTPVPSKMASLSISGSEILICEVKNLSHLQIGTLMLEAQQILVVVVGTYYAMKK